MTRFILISILLFSGLLSAQDGINPNLSIEDRLSILVSDYPQLEEEVELSAQNVPLTEFLRALGKNNGINISASSKIRGSIKQEFKEISLLHLLVFLCETEDLDFRVIGDVLHFFPKKSDKYKPFIQVHHSPADSINEYITLDLRNDSIHAICREITDQSEINLVYHPSIQNKTISLYLKAVPLDEALKQLCSNYDLKLSQKDSNLFLLEIDQAEPNAIAGLQSINKIDLNSEALKRQPEDSTKNVVFHIQSSGSSLKAVLQQLFNHFNADYIFYEDINGNVQADIQGNNLEDCLSKLLAHTEFTYKYDAPYYILGNKDQKSLIVSDQIHLRNRPVHKLIDFIPQNLLQKIEIIEFDELNSILVTGLYPDILLLNQFVNKIDKPVPVVMIEVIIVDYQKTSDLSTGLDAGIGSQPSSSGGSLYPGIEYNLNANSLNNLIQSFNGFGSLNLGSVTPNFYVNLQLLETNGLINVKSTPRITTLNGHQASISIGNTEYYVVEQTNITGVQNPIPITTRNYQSVQANFSLTITPYVADENKVTLEIQVEQTDFTARIAPEAPPGNVSRTFNSYIRVDNEDMILLGGLEEKGFNSTGSGIPWLSRIWGLKWLFSSRNRTDNKSKLNIFIKPVIIQ
tara:strand:+ start:373 stop:2262 length:1890 start_codon:yes stop_codon:yes gene_type:complete